MGKEETDLGMVTWTRSEQSAVVATSPVFGHFTRDTPDTVIPRAVAKAMPSIFDSRVWGCGTEKAVSWGLKGQSCRRPITEALLWLTAKPLSEIAAPLHPKCITSRASLTGFDLGLTSSERLRRSEGMEYASIGAGEVRFTSLCLFGRASNSRANDYTSPPVDYDTRVPRSRVGLKSEREPLHLPWV